MYENWSDQDQKNNTLINQNVERTFIKAIRLCLLFEYFYPLTLLNSASLSDVVLIIVFFGISILNSVLKGKKPILIFIRDCLITGGFTFMYGFGLHTPHSTLSYFYLFMFSVALLAKKILEYVIF